MALRLFDKWQGQSLDGIVAECRELVEDADFPTVRHWREAGEKSSWSFSGLLSRGNCSCGRDVAAEYAWRAR